MSETNQQHQSLFDAASEGYVVHEDGIIVEVNSYFEELVGFRSSELVGTSFVDLVAEESKALVIERMGSRPGKPFEIEGLRKDGSRIAVEVVGRDFQHDGRAVRVVTVRDLTEAIEAKRALAESERRFRDLFEQAPVWYLSVGIDGRIQLANRQAAEIMGCEPEDMVGRHVYDFCADAPEGKVRARDLFQRFREGQDIRGEEILMERADGGRPWISLSVQPILDANGDVVASRSVAIDITERKRLEEELRQAREQLERKVERRIDEGNQYGLTFRELTILHHVANGLQDKEIATRLGISPDTVHQHLRNLRRKMKAANRTEVAARALREGLVD